MEMWEELLNGWWVQLVLICATAWLAEMLNVRCVMVMGRSRLTLVMVLVMGLACLVAEPSVESCGEGLLWVLVVFLLFRTYQDRSATGRMYMTYLVLGVASVWEVKVLYLVPFLWWMTAGWLMSMSWRGWVASLLGLATPYWCLGAWALYVRDGSGLASHFEKFVEYSDVCEGIADLRLAVTLGVLAVLLVVGMVRYMRHSYRESIRNRMQHYTVFSLGILSCVIIVLQPCEGVWALRLLAYASAASVAHACLPHPSGVLR